MKRRLIALVTAIMIMSVSVIGASATGVSASSDLVMRYSVSPFASAYLDDYSISIGTRDNCRIVITMDVNAVRTMDRIGCMLLIIEHKVDGTWYEYDTLVSAEHPDFYMYNTASYLGSYSFYGEEGVQYRATMTAYAREGSGYDTGEITSYVITCRA